MNQSSKDPVETRFFPFAGESEPPFRFSDGCCMNHLQLAYETYGTLAPDRNNAVLVFHAMSGSAHAAGFNPGFPAVASRWTDECQTGWWTDFIGPGKAIDTDAFFVVCANYIGGCYGSSGPSSVNPATGKPYGRAFPMITLSDIVDTQVLLLNHLGIDQLHAVIGPSIGGMLTMNFAVRHPERVRHVIPMSSALSVSTLQRVLNFEQIYAIEEDANFCGGDYYEGDPPCQGLILARMIAHKTYISLSTLESRARGEIVQREEEMRAYSLTSPIESYMLHQGRKFVKRFDANSYLRILNAWQRYDLLQDSGYDSLPAMFAPCRDQCFLIFSIDTDVCYYPEEQSSMARCIREAGVTCQHITAHSEKGHDAFLLEPDLFAPQIDYWLKERYS